MHELDRLGWAAGLAFEAYGMRIGVRVNRSDALDRLPERLPPGWKPASSPVVDRLFSWWVGQERGSFRSYHLVYAGPVRRARTMSLDEALETLESDLRHTVAAFSRDRVFVHAGEVGWQGGGILVPGRTFSGKTSHAHRLNRTADAVWRLCDGRRTIPDIARALRPASRRDVAVSTKVPSPAY